MKKIVLISAAIISLAAFTTVTQAATEGAYAGGGLGYSKINTPDHNMTDDQPGLEQSRDIGGLGGRVFGGYNFNKYFGIESGIAHYAQSKYEASYGASSASVKYDLDALDVVGKAYLPIAESGFNIYALAGAALVHTKLKAEVNVEGYGSGSYSETQNKVRPKFGVGASYDIPQTHLTTSIEISRIQGTGNMNTDSNAIPNADLATLNLVYNFN